MRRPLARILMFLAGCCLLAPTTHAQAPDLLCTEDTDTCEYVFVEGRMGPTGAMIEWDYYASITDSAYVQHWRRRRREAHGEVRPEGVQHWILATEVDTTCGTRAQVFDCSAYRSLRFYMNPDAQ